MFELESSTLLIPARGLDFLTTTAQRKFARIPAKASVEPTVFQNSSIFIDVVVEMIRLPWPASAWCLLFSLTCYAPLVADCALRFEPVSTELSAKLRNGLLS
jgi:hypothetical protein